MLLGTEAPVLMPSGVKQPLLLLQAMTRLNDTGRFEKVRVVALNPKSITMGQLYGEFDDNTHEWTDGVLATYMRECCGDTHPDKKWIMFDGPVDAIWIENMNTVRPPGPALLLHLYPSGEVVSLIDPHLCVVLSLMPHPLGAVCVHAKIVWCCCLCASS